MLQGRVRFRTGCLLPALIAMFLVLGLFVIVAFDPGIDLSESRDRRSEFFQVLASFRWNGVSIPLVIFGLFIAYETQKFARQWISGIAIAYDENGLEFHPTLRKGKLFWHQVISLDHHDGGLRSIVRIVTTEKTVIVIDNCEEDDAKSLVAAFKAWRGGASATPRAND